MKPNREYDKNSVFTGIGKSKPCIHEIEKNFESIMNDYSLDTADKEKAMRRFIKTFGLNSEK